MGAAAMPVVFQSSAQAQAPVRQMPPVQPPAQFGYYAAPAQMSKQYSIQIKNMSFVPEHLTVEKGSTVTWQVCADTSGSRAHSMFYESSARSHIISFDDIHVESPKLELATASGQPRRDTFAMSFHDVGTYFYGCCIFSRMRGSIEVIDSQPHFFPYYQGHAMTMPPQLFSAPPLPHQHPQLAGPSA